ncbi:MAG: penicillin-binding protein 1C [Candidatus Eremiobacteraeota bacterium]|nr:penicillin-binding protein 1C [Candidatus Eremiobacteraeota bacterium]MBV8365663.1 penicillin-binding protein 1C [Candidatus Eremiobacteraeota bacterium]
MPVWRKKRVACVAAIALLLLVVRLVPFAFPIRAADLVQDSQAVEFTDRNGLPLGTLLARDQEHTAAVRLAHVSPLFAEAIVAAEDAHFYQHGPVDYRALARASYEALRAHHFVSGGSTIAMQLARMISAAPSTVPGKLIQIWTAWRISAGMSRAQILEAYLNRLPMGGNLYGVEAASRTYYGVAASDLDLAQASALAAIPNDPVGLDPYAHAKALKVRQAYVLERMVKSGFITRERAERARAEQLLLQTRGRGIVAAPHYLFWLGTRLPPHTARVRTTIDRPLQQFVEAQVRDVIGTLRSRNVHAAAAIVIDNRTGEVLAYTGSPDYFATAQQGSNDGVQALRQPGSTLKPFLYELALENRTIEPNTILADVPARYAIPGANLYSPVDYSDTFQGPVRVRIALADSLNVPAVRVLERVGVEPFLERLHRLGFSHLTHDAEYYGLGLTLGGGEVSLWELAHAYATIARRGVALPPLTWFSDNSASASNAVVRVGNATVWELVTDMIDDEHARAQAFGVSSALDMPFAAAVKTGTSSDFRDTWTVGFTSDYTVGVWVGNFNGDPMRRLSGVAGAAPLWNRIMLHLHEQRDPTPFAKPAGMVSRRICAQTGYKPTLDCEAVVSEYLWPDELSSYERPQRAAALPHEYDEWMALQHRTIAVADRFRVVAPRDGDAYLVARADVGRRPLEFQAAALPGQSVEWRLNGRSIGSGQSFFWPMRPGHFTIAATSAGRTDRVSFDVEEGTIARKLRPGFSIVGP